MSAEYLLFDLLILAGPLILSLMPFAKFRSRAKSIAFAVFVVGIPFVAWDAAVAGDHWWFDPRYTLGVTAFGLPIEEVLFFVAVPYACVFTWETVIRGASARPHEGGAWRYWLAFAMVPLGLVVAVVGPAYTGLTLLSLGLAATLDHALGTGLLRMRRYWALVAVVLGFTAIFNGYLTARPVVHYGADDFMGVRLGTIPLEDFGYGVALVTSAVAVFQWHQGRGVQPSWAARGIERAFGGYRHTLNTVDMSLPARVRVPRRVAVVGGGLAGLSAASLLAQRGFDVVLREAKQHLGGKIGAWKTTLPDGFETTIEHGFHAFFRHYYNLDEWLEQVGVRRSMKSIGRYEILTNDGRSLSFDDRKEAPILNLLGLARRGLYRLGPVAFGPAGKEMEAFMRYDADATFERFDDVPFSEFAERAQLPADLRTVFNTFSRAFFSDDDKLSTAELIKSFHFYYLSHDHGLGYDFVDGGYAEALVEPIAEHCRDHGVKLETGRGVHSLEPRDDGTWDVDGEHFDYVVLATDVAAAGKILRGSVGVSTQAPELLERFEHVRAGQRYAVLRVWLDRPVAEDHPVFVSTERDGILDAAAFVDRIDPEARAWALDHGGAVVELHCYAVPDDTPDDAIEAGLLEGMRKFFPSLREAEVAHAHLELQRDFTAFHVGMGKHRPGVETGVPGLMLAGDWVRLPCPAMLMEAAHTSGRMAANAIARAEGVREAVVYTVPTKGLLTKVPQRPTG